MSNFAILGVAGFVAPRHLKAIHDTGNRLVAAADTHDAVGVLDRFAFEVRFFNEIERLNLAYCGALEDALRSSGGPASWADALDSLEFALGKGWGDKGWVENDSDLDSLRQEPRYLALIQAL